MSQGSSQKVFKSSMASIQPITIMKTPPKRLTNSSSEKVS